MTHETPEAAALNERIAAEWPARWAKANAARNGSKARNSLRKEFRAHLKRDELRAAGASCATCRCFQRGKPYVGASFDGWCERDSDFHGYAVAKADGICTFWSKQ